MASVSNLNRLVAVVGLASLVLTSACGSDMGGDSQLGGDDTLTGDADNTTDASASTEDVTLPGPDDDGTTDDDATASTIDTADASDGIPLDVPRNIRIVTPVNGDEVRGAITVRIEPVGMDEREVTEVSLEVNGEPIFWDVKLPTELVLDTRDLGLFEFDLTAKMRDGFDTGDHRVRVRPDNPPMRFEEVTPANRILKDGDYVSIAVRMNTPSDVRLTGDFSAIDSNFDPTRVLSTPHVDQIFLTYRISEANTIPDGDYGIPITATIGNFEEVYTQLTLNLRNSPAIPINVRNGIYVEGALPQPSEAFVGPKPVLTVSNDTVLTGGSSTVNIDFSALPAPQDVVGVIFGIEGSNGYWQIPVDMHTASALPRLDADFFLRAFRSFEVVPPRLALRIAVRDVRGRVSPYASRQVEVLEVGTGDVQVSLSWDKDSDIDLHVRSPNGCEIFYGRTTCPNGGELDLDSNAGCNIDGTNNENVYWPSGNAPDGQYRVYVDHYANCGGGTVKYTVTVTYCNQVEIFEGTFSAGSEDHGGALSGRFITEFDVGQCSRTAKGKIRYQDRTFDKSGFAAYSWQQLEGARVELRSMADQSVIAAGTTDRNGNYEIGFPSDASIPGIFVVVQARTDPAIGLRDIQVFDHPKFDKLYEVSSVPIILYPDTLDVVQDLDIRIDQFAGAFNVFDTLRKAYDGVRLQNGRVLGELKAYWKTGTDTTDTFFCSQFLYETGECTELNTVSVQGKDTDRDEYDDMVIIKEFFKFALGKTSRDSHPGGNVDGRRDDARRAWTEGLAEFFAADVTGSRYYVNSRPYGVTLVDDLETMNTPFAYGVKTDGKLSHWLVAAMLWDLADPLNESWDSVESKKNGIYDVLFSYFPSESFVDRGAEGVDLSDFIDGWVCRGWGGPAMLQSSLDHFECDYGFDGPQQCTQQP